MSPFYFETELGSPGCSNHADNRGRRIEGLMKFLGSSLFFSFDGPF
ncbi:hypothetical protein DSM3645_21102 [Blastopirellula marina DSM 3645]|uniref:Uncharacterized protein n=1 Tax=Blastopirellula marina DSM 3645 TaxID=314230 RepID=A3ZR17_9BACT|nr:hypothetical protein DSM3645_21102 [Blastopirellula marina DSM 3645]